MANMMLRLVDQIESFFQRRRRLRELQEKDRPEVEKLCRDYPGIGDVDSVLQIRARNQVEAERYRQPYPSWPKSGHNRHGTMRRGVWIPDHLLRGLSDRQIDEFRDQYWSTHESIEFTLAEGDQDAPLGTDGAWIRVTAKQNDLHESYISNSDGHVTDYIPTFSYWPTHHESGESWWCFTSMGTLPATMRVTAKRLSLEDVSR